MCIILALNNSEILPNVEEFKNSKYENLLPSLLSEFNNLIKPTVILKNIDKDSFKKMLILEEDSAPVQIITNSSSYLSLFALTLGESISEKISELFEKKDYFSAYILDLFASKTVENAVQNLENNFLNTIKAKKNNLSVLAYSPGYCGWHISGQKNLFSSLKPEEIGIRLNEYFLMEPLKSVSGVLIAAENHFFEPNFVFCSSCKALKCRYKGS